MAGPGERVNFLVATKSPALPAGSRQFLAHIVETRLAQTSTAGGHPCRKVSALQRGRPRRLSFAIAGGVRAAARGAASDTIRRPGGAGQFGNFDLCRLVWCRRLAVIGRGLARRSDDFLWRRKSQSALPQRRLAPIALIHRPAGRVENSPWRTGRYRRDNSRQPRAASALPEGKAVAGSASPLPAACSAAPSRARRSGRFVAPAQASGQWLWSLLFGSRGAFGWR